ncbi:MAG TPA: EcsC family protein [Solirubrobacteraceae bacterium]|nr:EcsC family protein [Solirubrobacteraceae bacterium]
MADESAREPDDDDGVTDPGPAPVIPASLLKRIQADPVRAPELIALAASERHGPAARDWLAEQAPGTSPDKLAKRAKRTHARYARVTGGVTGLGGALTMVPDMAAAIWIQSRMVFFVAAAYGYDPLDPMRPAELLTLYDLYDDPVEARKALDGAGRTLAEAAVTRAISRSDEKTLVSRLAQMALKRGASRLAGRAIPGLAVIVNSIGNERQVRALADRAIAFYRG